MSFLVPFIRPLAYVSLPVFLLRFISSSSPAGRYIVRLGIYTSSMAVVAIFAFVASLGMSAVGMRYNVNWVVAKTFYFVCSTLLPIRVEVEGKEHIQTRPAVFVGNHQSMLDVIFLAKMLPKQISILAKKSLQWSILGPFMYMSGAVFIDRGNSATARRSIEAAGEGMKARKTSLFIYPEGTRHSQEVPDMLPFKKGAFHLAVQAGLPIVPVVVENYWRIFHKGVFDSGVLKMRVLPPITTTGLSIDDVSALADRVRAQMLEALRDLSVKVDSSPQSGPPAEPAPDLDIATDPTPPSEKHVHEMEPVREEDSVSSVSSSSHGGARLRQEGSENGVETEEDEGMVLVGRPL